MIEYIYSFVHNGSIVGRESYMAWLPFYDYGLYLIGLSLIFAFFAYLRNWDIAKRVYSLIVASILSVIPIYFMWLLFNSSPSTILLVWIVIIIIIYIICLKGISDAENRERMEKEDNERL